MMVFFFCCLLCSAFRYLSLNSEKLFILVRVIITLAIDVETQTIFIDGFLVLCWIFGLNIFHKFHNKTEWVTWTIPWPIFSPVVNFYCPYSYLALGFFSFYTPSGAVPSGYPNPTRYLVFLSIPDPTRFTFENPGVAGNPKHRVLPDISGKPDLSGTTRYFGYHP